MLMIISPPAQLPHPPAPSQEPSASFAADHFSAPKFLPELPRLRPQPQHPRFRHRQHRLPLRARGGPKIRLHSGQRAVIVVDEIGINRMKVLRWSHKVNGPQLYSEYVARMLSTELLTPADISGMFGLLWQHFDGVSTEQFQRDLAEKNWVLLIERSDRLVGFSTVLAYETSFAGTPYSIIYSGDTIVAPEAWNSSTLPRTWIESVAKLREIYPRGPYLWMLITSGFRTYRFLPLFWRGFFPRFDLPTPPHWKRLMDHLAAERFDQQYNPAKGVVQFKKPQRLRRIALEIPGGRLEDPHIAFFASRNSGYAEGDELVCLAELAPENLTAAGRRMTAAIAKW